ncbi:AbrB/MazE/SpoVT family DNA-binding domain-containing protein [Candidatus Woesearchaeota archaeon]|nr:AbrB/MazE/SpoVT family DNA-binding domain-containing protein [Candidatus Woesearchaeota archaeon]
MESVTVSEKFQVVIPKSIRGLLRLKPKQELTAWIEGDEIHLTPLKKIKDPVKTMASLTKKKFRISIERLEQELEGMLT